MSRSTHRALLTAPLLLGALLLSSCGGDDEAAVATSPPAAATTAAVGTSPTTPVATTPDATTPTTAGKEKGDAPAATDAAPAAAAPGSAGGAPGAGAATATTAKPPTQAPTKSADETQNKVLQVLAAVETCWAGSQSYEKCDGPDSLDMFGVKVVDSNRPGQNEVAVTNSSRDTFKIIGTDAEGVRWVLTKSGSGDVKRKCKLASGQACNPATW